LSKKFLTHDQGIDFAMSIFELERDREQFVQLVNRQIQCAEKLVEVMRTKHTTFTVYEKGLDVHK
jgi:hypothetical protein